MTVSLRCVALRASGSRPRDLSRLRLFGYGHIAYPAGTQVFRFPEVCRLFASARRGRFDPLLPRAARRDHLAHRDRLLSEDHRLRPTTPGLPGWDSGHRGSSDFRFRSMNCRLSGARSAWSRPGCSGISDLNGTFPIALCHHAKNSRGHVRRPVFFA